METQSIYRKLLDIVIDISDLAQKLNCILKVKEINDEMKQKAEDIIKEFQKRNVDARTLFLSLPKEEQDSYVDMLREGKKEIDILRDILNL